MQVVEKNWHLQPRGVNSGIMKWVDSPVNIKIFLEDHQEHRRNVDRLRGGDSLRDGDSDGGRANVR